MDISSGALDRIRELKALQRLPAKTGVRLVVEGGSVFLKWDEAGPREADLTISKRDFAVYLEARAYSRLADYRLDVQERDGVPCFVLRRKKIAAHRRKPS